MLHIFLKLHLSRIVKSFIFLVVLPFVQCSSHGKSQENNPDSTVQHVNSQKTFDITVHGILLWASTGCLTPLGVLIIRISTTERFGARFKVFFYMHAIFQVVAVMLATAGAVLSVKNFENAFDNSHQRLGLALYVAIYAQVLFGFRRPKRGSKTRKIWYFFHWLLGTTIPLVGIFNTYTGLNAYNKRTSKSISLWNILFTAQGSFMAVFYLFQDKWEYMQKQGVLPGDEPAIASTDQEIPNGDSQNLTETARKSNALGTYFSRSNALKKLLQLT